MDKFTKIRNIGKGNMGACALARNNEDGKYYVIKQVDLTKMNKKERQQSLNEARVLSSLRHPNIINYVDSFLARKSDHLCIVMEYADGGDLNSRIKKNYGVNFRETQVLDWFIQLVLSLHYVHKRKILHRDVKTQNVFLTSDNVVKLGDFGIARTLSNTYDQAKTFVGTPYYLSPELILERPYDHRSDVWALGVVLYELLTLKHPFNATDMKGLMQRILKVQYDPVPQMYSTEVRNLVPRLLMKDPTQRIQLAELLELPVVHDRLVEWMKLETMPRKYVEALQKQDVLPESVKKDAEEFMSKGSSSPGPSQEKEKVNTPTTTQVPSPTTTITSGVDVITDVALPPPPPPVPQPTTSTASAPVLNPIKLPSLAVAPPRAVPTKPTSARPRASNNGGRYNYGNGSSSSPVINNSSGSSRDPSAGPLLPKIGEISGGVAKPVKTNRSSYGNHLTPRNPSSNALPSTSRSNAPGSNSNRQNTADNLYQQLNYYRQGRQGAPANLYRPYAHPFSHGSYAMNGGGVSNSRFAPNSNNSYATSGIVGMNNNNSGNYYYNNNVNGNGNNNVASRRYGGLSRSPQNEAGAAAEAPPNNSPYRSQSNAPASIAKPETDIRAMLDRAVLERAKRRSSAERRA